MTVEQTIDPATKDHTYTYALTDDIKLGHDGKDGKPGKDGSIGVNGKDGSAVVINGKDGSIGLNGKDGKDGLTIKGANGQDGVDGKMVLMVSPVSYTKTKTTINTKWQLLTTA